MRDRWVYCRLLQLLTACMIFFIVYNHIGFLPGKILTDQSPAHFKNNCSCKFKNVTYDFCYHLPSNRLIKGKRFECSFSSNLEKFGILSLTNSIDLETEEMPVPAFVTAMSENHYAEGITMVANFRNLWPSQKLIIYDLGLEQESKKFLQNKCLVELRSFPFEAFPNYVHDLTQYRWKPLLIAPAYMLHHPSDHSIFATTHPEMYKYIPTDIEAIKKTMNYDAGFQFIVATADAREILKWYVLCALEEDCMAPHGAELYCVFQNDSFNRYAGCHRYDQSAINLLLTNLFGYNATNYVSNLGDGADIEGSASYGLTDTNFSCVEEVSH